MTTRKASQPKKRSTASSLKGSKGLKMSRRSGRGRAMTVQEAGRLGGLVGGRKGGLAVKRERGVEFFAEIGKLGGQRLKALVAAGRKATERQRARGARR